MPNPLDAYLTSGQQVLLAQAIDEVRQDGQGHGRVELVYDNGELKFIQPQRSYNALPGYLGENPVASSKGPASHA